jgi:hypothetical protein
MTINYIIDGMYENTHPIVCDFEMIYNDKIICSGEAVINRNSEELCLVGKYEDINMGKFQVGGKISMDDLFPIYVQVKLFNFQHRGRITRLKDKNITVDIPKFKLSPNFTLSMDSDSCTFEIYGQPLMSVEDRELANITIVD